MKRVLMLIPILVGGVIVGRRLLPAEWRQGLSRLPGATMGRMMKAKRAADGVRADSLFDRQPSPVT